MVIRLCISHTNSSKLSQRFCYLAFRFFLGSVWSNESPVDVFGSLDKRILMSRGARPRRGGMLASSAFWARWCRRWAGERHIGNSSRCGLEEGEVAARHGKPFRDIARPFELPVGVYCYQPGAQGSESREKLIRALSAPTFQSLCGLSG